MSRPSDRHLDLVDEDAYQRAADAISALGEAGIDYVLGGGWAVFAHVPRLPSVDVDVYIGSREASAARQAVEETGLNIERGGEVELLGLDTEIRLWGIGDPDLGIPEPSYTPQELFRDHLEERPLDLEGRELRTVIPDRPSLLVTKAVALANRDLAYRAFSDGEAGMRLGPQRLGRVRSKARGYWERKAGKDLFDIGLLVSKEVTPAARDLLEAFDLLEGVRETTDELSEQTSTFARDLADRRSVGDPVEALGLWLNP